MNETYYSASHAGLPRPSRIQLAYQQRERIAFIHFTVNTFTDKEWGDGSESPSLFNPTELDARQWARVCRDAGMTMALLTCKHCDGFCLWPSRFTEHSVKYSPWRGGKGDLVREFSDACREFGIGFGIYLSPWDRHDSSYGTPVYNDYFVNQLRELLTNYGEVGDVWLDGGCGEGSDGKHQVYDWSRYYSVVRELQPSAVISICGPDVRWVGNESGLARESEPSVQRVPSDLEHDPPDWVEYHGIFAASGGITYANQEFRGTAAWERTAWYPAECDVSIRPGWFYHKSEDLLLRPLEELVDIYYRSVGRNSVFLLNIPPDQRGLLHGYDVERLMELRHAIDATFAENLAKKKSVSATSHADGRLPEAIVDGDPESFWLAAAEDRAPSLEIDLGEPATFNRLLLQEKITESERTVEWVLEGLFAGTWRKITSGQVIGYKRLERFGAVTLQKVRLRFTQIAAPPTLSAFGLYKAFPGG